MTLKGPAMNETSDKGPRLSVSILVKNAEARLGRLLAEVSTFADEIVVGVDDSTADRTLEIATGLADVVFSFRHSDQLAAARMAIFDYATGDWILVLDDDESLEPGFADLLPKLMADATATHYWFSRKWVVNTEPYEFLFAPPWFPDWQLRLFRNDRALVWKPSRPHSGYHVLGPGRFEHGVAILHFEPLWCSPESRAEKLATYAMGGPRGDWLAHYNIPSHIPRRPCAGLAESETLPTARQTRLIAETYPADRPPMPPWGAEILEVDMVAATHCNHEVLARVRLRNTGQLAWWPTWGIRSASLYLSHHLRSVDGKLVRWDCERTLTLDIVPPGGEAIYLHQFKAPETPGDYLLEWDMVSEGEAWFAEAQPRRPTYSPLHVVA
jgi:hypothetical protein